MVSGQSEHIPSVVGLPNAAEVLIKALNRQGQSCCWCLAEPRAPLPSSSQLEQASAGLKFEGFNIVEEIKKNPNQVSWIGKPSPSPLAVIHGPTGTYAVTKNVIVIGRSTTSSEIDLNFQEANSHGNFYMVLSYTGYPNRWGVQINGISGVIINKKLYQQATIPQYLPYSCVFNFPPSSRSYFFRAVELPRCNTAPHVNTCLNGVCKGIVKECTLNEQRNLNHRVVDPCQVSSPSSSDEISDTASSIPASNQKNEFLSVDENKEESSKNDEKPPYSYAQLIAQAIMSTTDKQITLSGIYNFIMQKYPWYQSCDKGWQNSIRHNLSLSRYFVKIARTQNEPGKGSFWKMEAQTAQRNMEVAYEKKKPKSFKGFKLANSSVSDLEDYFSEGQSTPPLETSKTSYEDSIEIIDRQESSLLASNEESSILHQMISNNSNSPYQQQQKQQQPQPQQQTQKQQLKTVTLRENQIPISQTSNTTTEAAEVVIVKDLPKLTERPEKERLPDIDSGNLAELDRCSKWPTRTAQSAPCSPKGNSFRLEQSNAGSSFRVRQSVKDGRFSLQLCHSQPEYRTTLHNRNQKAVHSNSSNQSLYQLRGGTKSLSTTPVRELLQGTSGLRFEDLKRDLPKFSNRSATNDKNTEQTTNGTDDTVATTSFFPRSNSDSAAPPFIMAHEQHANSYCKLKMSIYGKHSEHNEKLKNLDEVYEEVKSVPLNNFDSGSIKVTRKYGMDGTIRPDIDKLLAESKRLNGVAMIPVQRIDLSRMSQKRKHEDEDDSEEVFKRCHSDEMVQKGSLFSQKEFMATAMQRSIDVVKSNNDGQVVHLSEPSSVLQLNAQFGRENLLMHTSQPTVANPVVAVSPLKDYPKQAAKKRDCIAKPIPLGPSGPAVKQLLAQGKPDFGFIAGKRDLDSLKQSENLLCSPVGVCRDNKNAFSPVPVSSRNESSLLYREVAPNTIQASLHMNPTVTPLSATVNNYSANLPTSLHAGICSTAPQMQRGIVTAPPVSTNNLHPGMFAPKARIPVNVQAEVMNTKTLNSNPLAGKMFSPMLQDVNFTALQNLTRSQATGANPQQPIVLNLAQPSGNLQNLQLPPTISGIRLPSALSLLKTLNATPTVCSSFSAPTERSSNDVVTLLQNQKQQAEQLNMSREQQNISQEYIDAKLNFENYARLMAEQMIQQQQQQQNLFAAAFQSITQDQISDPAINNALLNQCLGINFRQLKTSTASNNLNSLLLPASNPIALLTAQNSYMPLTSRTDLNGNGVVNNGVCELIGMPTRSATSFLDTRDVTSL